MHRPPCTRAKPDPTATVSESSMVLFQDPLSRSSPRYINIARDRTVSSAVRGLGGLASIRTSAWRATFRSSSPTVRAVLGRFSRPFGPPNWAGAPGSSTSSSWSSSSSVSPSASASEPERKPCGSSPRREPSSGAGDGEGAPDRRRGGRGILGKLSFELFSAACLSVLGIRWTGWAGKEDQMDEGGQLTRELAQPVGDGCMRKNLQLPICLLPSLAPFGVSCVNSSGLESLVCGGSRGGKAERGRKDPSRSRSNQPLTESLKDSDIVLSEIYDITVMSIVL